MLIIFCVCIGIGCVCASAISVHAQSVEQKTIEKKVHSFDKIQFEKTIPVRITIENFLSVLIEPTTVSPPFWGVSKEKANYLLESARLGQAGNVVVYGHNNDLIFRKLGKVSTGQIIILINSHGEEFRYKVESVTQVDPDDISILQDTQEPILTLYTCTGFLDSKRLVVKARLSE